MDTLIWILVWVLGSVICMVGFYINNERLTLTYAIASLLLWWLIVPCGAFIIFIGGIGWLLENGDKIVLLDKYEMRAKRAMKKVNERNSLRDALEKLQNQAEEMEKGKLNNNNIKK